MDLLMTQAERIASLETTVAALKDEQEKTNQKLDELLALRYKGAGAFWLASALVGTGIIGFLGMVFGWFK